MPARRPIQSSRLGKAEQVALGAVPNPYTPKHENKKREKETEGEQRKRSSTAGALLLAWLFLRQYSLFSPHIIIRVSVPALLVQ